MLIFSSVIYTLCFALGIKDTVGLKQSCPQNKRYCYIEQKDYKFHHSIWFKEIIWKNKIL